MVKKVLATLFIVLLVLVLVVLAVASTRPSDFKVERQASLPAPPATVFPLVNDLGRWPQWSPWEKLDPNMKRTISEPSSGTGATYAWTGNNQVGEGVMTIVSSEPNARVGLRLDFVKPWASTSQTVVDIAPSDAGSQVTWTMTGKHDLMSKVMCLFVDMDKMMGKDFESGLANLGTVAAQSPAPADTLSAPADTLAR